jgi:acyl carrier protein
MQILTRIHALAAGKLGLESSSFSPDTRLDSLGIDSLALAELLFLIEDEFHVTFSQAGDPLQTVNDLVQFVQHSIVSGNHRY